MEQLYTPDSQPVLLPEWGEEGAGRKNTATTCTIALQSQYKSNRDR